MTEVSVMMTLFGEGRDGDTMRAVVDSWLDQDISCEVVIATDGNTRLDAEFAGRDDDRVRVVASPTGTPSRGLLGNVAAEAAQGDWLYISDMDVVPLSRTYLRDAKAAAEAAGGFLTQPRMLRLVGMPPAGPPWRWALPESSDTVCFVRRGELDELVHLPGETVFVWSDFDGQLWVDPPAHLAASRAGEFSRRPALHWGAVLVDRQRFASVGGYCEQYVGWGCEDEDLLHKLTSTAPEVKAWARHGELLCLHFEHGPARDTPEYEANRVRLEERRNSGAEAMIADDLRRLDASELR